MCCTCDLYLGHLLIKNKALAGGKRYRTTRFVQTPVQANEDIQLQLNVRSSHCTYWNPQLYAPFSCVQKKIAEEEKVQRAALDLLTSRQKGSKKTMEEVIEEAESTEVVGKF